MAVLCLLTAAGANAQTYVFSSCSTGVTFRMTINSIISKTGPTVLPPNNSRAYNYIFMGSYSLTVNGSTLTSTGLGTAGILYTGLNVTAPFTTFLVHAPNAAGTGGPGLGARADALSWGVSLQGDGDLLPNGLVPTLPSINAWSLPNGGQNQDTIFGDGKTLAQPVETLGDCSLQPLLDLLKMLGNLVEASCHCGDPINVATGNLFEQFEDYQTAGPNKLAFSRSYNSQATSTTFAASLGPNWRTVYDRYLRIVSATSVIAERADGSQVTFTLSGGNWTTDADVDLKLTNSGSTWTLTDWNDAVETYRTASATQALLQTIRTRNGYTQTLQYNTANQPTSVTDSYNRQLGFTYSAGRLQSLATPDGLTISYGYTGGRLTSVGYSTTPTTSQTYFYENASLPTALTGVVDENGTRYLTWTYDARGRAISSQRGAGASLTRVAYNDTDGTRTVTHPLGAQEVYRFTTVQRVRKVTQIDRLATATTEAATIKYTYDSNGYMASQTDWNGNLTTYMNDARGRPIRVVAASGTTEARTTAIDYHPTFRLPAKIAEPGLTTSFAYDNSGNMLTRTLADTTTTTVPYPTSGTSRTWTYTWSNSLLATSKKPRADASAATKFTYDSTGALTAVTNALGQTTRVTKHLPGGLPQTIVDPNGVTTELTYDARLRLLSRTVNTAAGPLMTAYKSDAAGNLLMVTRPDGSALTNQYDEAHRFTGVTDVFSQSIAYTLDALGNQIQTSVLDSSGTPRFTRSNSFDALGRLQQETGGAGQASAFTYDAKGNTLTLTDPLSRVTLRSFDALDRPVRIVDPANGVIVMSYDPQGRPTSVTDPKGGITTYIYNGFGDVIQRVSPDTGTTVYRYDLDGNLTQTVDAGGATANYGYDALGRRASVSYPDDPASNAVLTYDESGPGLSGHGFGIGRLTTVRDAAGTLSRSFDEQGNLLSETRTSGAATLVTSYSYDALNRIASITYPSGWTAAYSRDAMGRVTAVTAQPPDGSAPVPVVSGVAYQPFGPVNALAFGNGVAGTRSFDLDYRMTGLADAGFTALQSLTYAYDAASNVLSIADGITDGNTQTFGYDALNRLSSAAGAYGSFTYAYDSVGNRLTASQSGSVTQYSYSPNGNQLTAVTAGDAAQTLGYTKAGQLTSFNTAAGDTAALGYNQAGRLSSLTVGTGVAAQYIYDAFGQRLARTGSVTATTLYQYDRGGRLLEEADAQGKAQVDYIYLDSLPVATVSPGDGQIYFLHAGRLGAPQVATDVNQNVVWTAGYGPFGEMSAVPANVVQNLRLPGQEYDVETGLYHNGFRDYVPAWGRYLQSDPIGLGGGLNPYVYAEANPVNRTDPTGLETAEYWNNAVNGLRNKIDDLESYAQVQWAEVKALGPGQYLQSIPCVHAVEAAAKEAYQKAQEVYQKYAPVKAVYDFMKAAWVLTEDVALGTIGLAPYLFKWGSQQQDWADKCGSCKDY